MAYSIIFTNQTTGRVVTVRIAGKSVVSRKRI